jgi:hypothetical protein
MVLKLTGSRSAELGRGVETVAGEWRPERRQAKMRPCGADAVLLVFGVAS